MIAGKWQSWTLNTWSLVPNQTQFYSGPDSGTRDPGKSGFQTVVPSCGRSPNSSSSLGCGFQHNMRTYRELSAQISAPQTQTPLSTAQPWGQQAPTPCKVLSLQSPSQSCVSRNHCAHIQMGTPAKPGNASKKTGPHPVNWAAVLEIKPGLLNTPEKFSDESTG